MSREFRLLSILKSANIKVEPDDEDQPIENEDNLISSNNLFESTLLPATLAPWAINEDPINPIKQEPDTETEDEAEQVTEVDSIVTDYLCDRAEDVKQRLVEQNERLIVHMPKRFEVPIPDSDASPLAISAHNSTYAFQATSKTAKYVAHNSNLYPNLPFDVQQNARRIGADPTKIKSSLDPRIKSSLDPRLQKANYTAFQEPRTAQYSQSSLTNTLQSSSSSTAPQSSSSIAIAHRPKDTKNASTQTSKNTGTLYVELTENRLRNLSKDEKEVLRKFKEVRKTVIYVIKLLSII